MRTRLWLTGIGLILALGSGTAAQQPARVDLIPPVPSLNFGAPWKPVNVANQATQVIGSVIDVSQAPVAKVKVRLRNLVTGEIVQEAVTDENGEYTFDVAESGTYVVEMVLPGGIVIGLSNAGSIANFETVQTVVQLPGAWNATSQTVVPARNMSAFAGVSSATSMTATTLTIAVDQKVTPVDAGEPVSPVTPR